MDFKDVTEIIRRLNVEVHPIINLSSLMVYLRAWFHPATYQPIERHIDNHGEAITAALKFFDPFKCRPQYFPKLIAALRFTKQIAVYDLFKAEIRKYYGDKRADKLREVLDLISKEERKLGIDDEDDDNTREGNNIPGAGGSGGSEGDGRSGGDGMSAEKGQVDSVPCKRQPHDRPQTTGGATGTGPAVGRGSDTNQVFYRRDRPGSEPAASRGSDPTQVMCRIDRSVSGSKISDLRGSVYSKLGKALEETDSDQNPLWQFLIDEGDVEISREEQLRLEGVRDQGKKFLDLLAEKHYTIEQLMELFSRCGIDRALQILTDNQNRVVKSQQKTTSNDANNLNSSIQQKQVPLKMNIPGPNPVQELPDSPLQIDAPETPRSNIAHNDRPLLSLDDNTALPESVKGTTPVQEHSTGRRCAEWDNTPSAGNLLPMDPAGGTNRNSENTGTEEERIGNLQVESNSEVESGKSTVEPKQPRDEGAYVTGVNVVPASLSLSDIDNVGSQSAITEEVNSTQNNTNNAPPLTDDAPPDDVPPLTDDAPPLTDDAPPITDDAPPLTDDASTGDATGDVTSANASANSSQLPTVLDSFSSSYSTLSIPDNSNGGNLPNFHDDDDNNTSS